MGPQVIQKLVSAAGETQILVGSVSSLVTWKMQVHFPNGGVSGHISFVDVAIRIFVSDHPGSPKYSDAFWLHAKLRSKK